MHNLPDAVAAPAFARAFVNMQKITCQRALRIAYHHNGFTPDETRHAIESVRDMRRTDLTGPNPGQGLPWAIYVAARCSDRRIVEFQRRAVEHRRLFTTRLGTIAENYFRSELIQASRRNGPEFLHIPRRHNTGRIMHPDALKPDLYVQWRYRGRTVDLAVEIKNECLVYGPDGQFNDCRRGLARCLHVALSLDALPLFVCAYASADCVRFCRTIGAALLVWNRQILPAGKRGTVARLFAILGTTAFEYAARRPFQSYISPGSESDIGLLANPLLIAAALNRWHEASQILRGYMTLMLQGKKKAFRDAEAAVDRHFGEIAGLFDPLRAA